MRADGWNRIPLVRMTTVSLEPGDVGLRRPHRRHRATASTSRPTTRGRSTTSASTSSSRARSAGRSRTASSARMVKQPQLHRHHAAVLELAATRSARASHWRRVGPAQLRQGRADAGRPRRARRRARPLPRRAGGGGTLMMTPRAGPRARPHASSRMTAADEAEVLVAAESQRAHPLRQQPHPPERRRGRTRVVSVRAVARQAHRRRVHQPPRRRSRFAARCEAAVAAARVAPEDPTFPGLPGPRAGRDAPTARRAATRAFDAEARARGGRARSSGSRATRGLTAAGKVRRRRARRRGRQLARRRRRRMALTGAQATVLSMGAGRRQRLGVASSARDAARARRRRRSATRRPTSPCARRTRPTLDPGDYTVVLAPEAVADILDFLALHGVLGEGGRGGPLVHERQARASRCMSELVTIVDDALADARAGHSPSTTRACPSDRVALVERGVAVQPVTDSYWAAKTGRPNTGHALPAPNSFGPMPLNLEMAAGRRDARRAHRRGGARRLRDALPLRQRRGPRHACCSRA